MAKRRKRPALGTKHHDKNRPMSANYTRVNVALDDTMFARIRGLATTYETSFAEQVRALLRRALSENPF